MITVRKLIRNFFIFLITIGLVAGLTLPVRAEDGIDDTPVDFVLVLDCSGSMTKNDPEGLTGAAAKEFVDLLPVDKNVRLSIVTFGDDYGTQAVDLGRAPDRSTSRVKVAYDLQNVSNSEDRDKAKAVIEQEIAANGQLSPIGYALEAAARLLDEKGTAKDHAAIILLSDGQVEGQSDDFNGGMDFDSIDQAISIAQTSAWPIFCMELNYRGENKEGPGLPGIAYHQMRKKIPSKTGTEPIELKSAEQAAEVFRQIFKAYFPDSETHDIGTETIKDGKAEFEDNITDLLAEENVLFEGKTSEVNKIDVTAPGGQTTTLNASDKSGSTGQIVYSFEDKYIAVKVMAPETGVWKYTVYGTDDVTIKATGVKLMETNLNLWASVNSGEITAGTKVDFRSTYTYNGKDYDNESFYTSHPAKLFIEGTAYDMTPSAEGYKASYTFEKKGSYTVYVKVVDDGFRNGEKVSGEFHYTIGNEPTKVKGTMQTVKTHCKGGTAPIDLTQYFESPDGDALTYEVEYDKAYGIQNQLSPDGKLTMKAGEKAGTYHIEVYAKDGSGEDPVMQEFDFTVENTPLKMIKSVDPQNPETVDLSVPGEKAKHPSEFVVQCSEYFEDPDDCMPRIAIFTDETGGAVDYKYDPATGTVTFIAVAEGEGNAEIIALDENDPAEVSFQQHLPYYFIVTDEGKEYGRTVRAIAMAGGGVGAILLAILGALFLGRKIYGTWDIYSDGAGTESERKIGTTGSGKHAKCRLDSLLSELDLNTGFPGVNLVAGNNLNKAVFITGLQNMSVELDGEPIEDQKKLAKIAIKPGHDIRIRSDMSTVTLTRLN